MISICQRLIVLVLKKSVFDIVIAENVLIITHLKMKCHFVQGRRFKKNGFVFSFI